MRRLFAEVQLAPCSEFVALAVRHAQNVIDDGATWRESFAPGAWLGRGPDARVTLSHDGVDVGYVVQVLAQRDWHVADLVIEDGPHYDEARERIRVGQPVSLDARSLNRDDDVDLYIRRHYVVKLEAVAILADGETPAYDGARVTFVRERTGENSKAALPTSRSAGEIIHHHSGVLVRNCGVVTAVGGVPTGL